MKYDHWVLLSNRHLHNAHQNHLPVETDSARPAPFSLSPIHLTYNEEIRCLSLTGLSHLYPGFFYGKETCWLYTNIPTTLTVLSLAGYCICFNMAGRQAGLTRAVPSWFWQPGLFVYLAWAQCYSQGWRRDNCMLSGLQADCLSCFSMINLDTQHLRP